MATRLLKNEGKGYEKYIYIFFQSIQSFNFYDYVLAICLILFGSHFRSLRNSCPTVLSPPHGFVDWLTSLATTIYISSQFDPNRTFIKHNVKTMVPLQLVMSSVVEHLDLHGSPQNAQIKETE